MAKKVLISGYIGFDNFGDDAIFEHVIENLKERNLEVSAFSSKPQETENRYDIKAYEYKNIKKIFEAISKTDVLISGGGSLFQNGTSFLSLIYYAFIVILAKLFFKKVIILGQGVGPIYDTFSELLTAFCFRISDIVTVRDSSSFNFLKTYKIKGELFPDPVWSINLPNYEPTNTIGIQVRNSKKINDIFLKNFAHYIGVFYQDKPIKIFLMQNTQDKPIALELRSLIREEFPNTNVQIVEYTNVQNLLNDFSHLDKLIAMRYHACLIGYRLGIKTLCLSYDKKIDELCKDFQTKPVQISISTDFYKEFENFYNWKETPIFEQKRRKNFDWEYFDNILRKEEN